MGKIKSFLFENKSVRQTVAKNTFWLFSGEILGRVIYAIFIIYAARILGASSWGTFSYVLSLATIFMVFSDIGINVITIRELAKDTPDKYKYLSTAFFIKITLLVLSVFAVIIFAPFLNKVQAAKSLIILVASMLFFDSLREFFLSIPRALEKMEHVAFIKIFSYSMIAVLGVIFLTLDPTPISLAKAHILGGIIGLLTVSLVIKDHIKEIFQNFSKHLIKPLFASAWSLALLNLFWMIMLHIDTVMLGWWRNSHEIGLYSASQRIMQFLYLFPNILIFALLPAFSRFANTDNEKFRNILEKSLALIFAVAIPLTAGGFIFSDEIILFLFGQGYLAATGIFTILMFTVLTVFPIIIINNAITAYDKQEKIIKTTALGLLFNVLLNLYLIPKYGAVGASISIVLSQIFILIANWRQMKKINYFKALVYLKRIIPATILMTLIALVIRSFNVNFLLNIAISSVAYFAILYLMKEPLFEDLKIALNPKD
jgi:O-antigen/teichoic acid export membrane protein